VAGTTHKDLLVWRKGLDLVIACYALTRTLPTDERFGLISQMRRAATSIPTNIAEGHARRSRQTYAHHVSIALGSQSELETLVELCRRLNFGSASGLDAFEQDLQTVGRLLYGLHRALRRGNS
jgi:four helix bundle protein